MNRPAAFFVRTFLCAALFSALCGCFAPVPQGASQSFVSNKDLSGAALLKQSQTLYNSGRLVDAELRLRQAHYLFPAARNISANLAMVLLLNGDRSAALALYDESRANAPRTVALEHEWARTLYAIGAYDESGEQLLGLYQGFLDAGRLSEASAVGRDIAVLKFRLGDEIGALCYSSDSFYLAPNLNDGIRHLRLIIALQHFNRADGFIAELRTRFGGDDNARLTYLRALTAFGLGKEEQGVSLLEAAIAARADLADFEGEAAYLADIFKKKRAREAGEQNTEGKEAGAAITLPEGSVNYLPAILFPLISTEEPGQEGTAS